MSLYQWVTQERAGRQLEDIAPGLSGSRRMTFQLNRGGMVSGEMDANHPLCRKDLGLEEGVHELVVYRDGVPLETVFRLCEPDIGATTDAATVGFQWQGIQSYFQDALVLAQASAYSGTTLPWTWINTFQARTGGAYSVTQGAQTGTAPTRTKQVQQDAGLMDAIIQLSEANNGFDFGIDAARRWNEWHTQRGSDRGVHLELGVNIAEVGWKKNAGPGELVSDLWVHGPPGSASVVASDTAARTKYGRRESSLGFFADMEAVAVSTGQLQGYANSIIDDRVKPLAIPKLRLERDALEWGSYWLGDTVHVVAEIGNYDRLDGKYRIVQIDVDVDENDNEKISLGVNAL